MSRHTIELPSTTQSGRAVLIMGFEIIRGPHIFAMLHDAEDTSNYVWASFTSPMFMNAQCPTEFIPVMDGFGVEIPVFIIQALQEDWFKQQLGTEYTWQEDGTFTQVR